MFKRVKVSGEKVSLSAVCHAPPNGHSGAILPSVVFWLFFYHGERQQQPVAEPRALQLAQRKYAGVPSWLCVYLLGGSTSKPWIESEEVSIPLKERPSIHHSKAQANSSEELWDAVSISRATPKNAAKTSETARGRAAAACQVTPRKLGPLAVSMCRCCFGTRKVGHSKKPKPVPSQKMGCPN